MMKTADMRFRITYTSPRKPDRVVSGDHFARSSAFYPVLRLSVGEYIDRRYHTAGYRRITRVS
jgi:hypothetical protein